MNRNLAIDCAFIEGKPYLYFGFKRFKKEDNKKIDETNEELQNGGFSVIMMDKKNTVELHVFKGRHASGPVPCKKEATDWDNPKFILEKKGEHWFDVYKMR